MAKESAKKAAPAKKDKKPNIFVRAGKYIAGCFKELKNVSWPTRKDLFKMTGAVIVFLVLMTIVLGAMDILGTLMLQALA